MAKKKAKAHTHDLSLVCDHAERLVPRNQAQARYMRDIQQSDITFGIGPAGTGKTFVPAVLAAQMLYDNQVRKIVVCRPAVEACDEKLGFLPGGLNDKMDPYLRPVFDAFHSFWPVSVIEHKRRNMEIEIVPLAYMRGRTFESSFILADEMQNASEDQMIMLLTRMGDNSKMVITGDPEQRDKRTARGFEVAKTKLSQLHGVKFTDFAIDDVVRHPIVGEILNSWS